MINSIQASESISPKEFGRVIGVSESTLKRWIDSGEVKAHKTVGGHRRILIKDALVFIRAKALDVVDPQPLKIPMSSIPDDINECNKLFLEYLRNGRGSEAKDLIFNQFLKGSTISQLGDGPIKYALQILSENNGQEYTDNLILEEHRATQICIRIVDYLHEFVVSNNPVFKAVGGGVPGDYYSLPSMLVSAVVSENNGYSVNLGPNTPFGVLRSASTLLDEAERPEIVWISVSSLINVTEISNQLCDFAKECSDSGIRLIVGGRAVPQLILTDPSLIKIHSDLESISFEFPKLK